MADQNPSPPASHEPAKLGTLNPDEPEIFRDFFNVRRNELALEQRRIDKEEKADERAHAYAMAALEARKTENKELRGIYATGNLIRNVTIAVAVLLVILLVFYCIHTGRTEFAVELIKTIALLVGGLGAGYVFGHRKGRQDAASSEDDG